MRNNKNINKVSIIMGSQSDYSTMKFCEKVLKILKISFEKKIISAHRTPKRMFEYARNAEKNNISVIIAGAGGSAHLPGMVAAITRIPVNINGNTTILYIFVYKPAGSSDTIYYIHFVSFMVVSKLTLKTTTS